MSHLPDEYSTLTAGFDFVQAANEDIRVSTQAEHMIGTKWLLGMTADK